MSEASSPANERPQETKAEPTGGEAQPESTKNGAGILRRRE